MNRRECTRCGRVKPLADFGVDNRRADGRGSHCKACKAAAERARTKAKAKPGALVLVMPPRPVPVEVPATPPGVTTPGAAHVADAGSEGVSDTRVRHGHYAQAVEEFLGALRPPHGPADALLVVNLRDLAQTADQMHLGPMDPADLNRITLSLVKLQRELAATRLSKAVDGQPAEAPRSKFEAFRDAQ